MQLHDISTPFKKAKTRVGRGISAGRGKTAGRGTKGQKSRSGFNIPNRFEGGQTSLIQRLPKIRGFKSHRIKPTSINIKRIEEFYKDGETVSLNTLVEKGLLNSFPKIGVKIIGDKKLLTKKINFDSELCMSAALGSKLDTKEDKTPKK